MIASILADALVDVLTHPVTIVSAVVGIPTFLVAWVVDLRNSRTEEPLQRLGPNDWAEDVDVKVPGFGPDKRRVTGFGRRFPVRFAWEAPSEPARYDHPAPPHVAASPARLTPRRIPVTAPASAPTLPAQLWPDLVGPTTQPVRTVFTAHVETRQVHVPAPEKRAS